MIEHIVPGDDHGRDDAEALQGGDERPSGGAVSTPATANSGTSAMSGIAERSWNSSTAKPKRPWRVLRSPVSSMTCRANAVEESASARPMKIAVSQAKPSTSAISASSSAGDADLRPAQTEHGVAHRPQALGPQLQPDHEQQQHDAELGELEDLLGFVVGEHPAEVEGPSSTPAIR